MTRKYEIGDLVEHRSIVIHSTPKGSLVEQWHWFPARITGIRTAKSSKRRGIPGALEYEVVSENFSGWTSPERIGDLADHSATKKIRDRLDGVLDLCKKKIEELREILLSPQLPPASGAALLQENWRELEAVLIEVSEMIKAAKLVYAAPRAIKLNDEARLLEALVNIGRGNYFVPGQSVLLYDGKGWGPAKIIALRLSKRNSIDYKVQSQDFDGWSEVENVKRLT